MRKSFAVLLCCLLMFMAVGCGQKTETGGTEISGENTEPIQIKVLVLPKFESGELTGDFPGEAQYYYEGYCAGGQEYEIAGNFQGNKLYVKDGVALYITGMGKVNAAISLMAVLQDSRFDFSDTYILSTGCAGSAYGSTVMGDVVLGTATADYDLGHTADPRDLMEDTDHTWFVDESYDSSSHKLMNPELMGKVYALIRDVPVKSTENTKDFMFRAFEGAQWATRDPMVLRGTVITSDDYWKGMYNHDKAILVTETYGCPDPYAITEMEDHALAVVADRMGMLDRFLVLRDSVNMDVFMNGATPEQLWDPDFDDTLASPESTEAADIFATAMENNFMVGKVIIDAILDGTL